MEEERLRPPSPPPVVHYTDHEAAGVAEKLKQDDTFTKGVQVSIKYFQRTIEGKSICCSTFELQYFFNVYSTSNLIVNFAKLM